MISKYYISQADQQRASSYHSLWCSSKSRTLKKWRFWNGGNREYGMWRTRDRREWVRIQRISVWWRDWETDSRYLYPGLNHEWMNQYHQWYIRWSLDIHVRCLPKKCSGILKWTNVRKNQSTSPYLRIAVIFSMRCKTASIRSLYFWNTLWVDLTVNFSVCVMVPTTYLRACRALYSE